jgi:hypothetical protein
MLVAKIKSGTPESYLTAGKEYPVIERFAEDGIFTFLDDENEMCLCGETDCYHLNGGSWELIEKGE